MIQIGLTCVGRNPMNIVGYDVRGHGSTTICAAVSAITQSTYCALNKALSDDEVTLVRAGVGEFAVRFKKDWRTGKSDGLIGYVEGCLAVMKAFLTDMEMQNQILVGYMFEPEEEEGEKIGTGRERE